MTGDFNVRVDRPDDINSTSLKELLTSFDLVQHVKESMHDLDGTLDLIITRSDSQVNALTVKWNGISDHALVSFSANAAKPPELCLRTMAPTWKNFKQALFNMDLMESIYIIHESSQFTTSSQADKP